MTRKNIGGQLDYRLLARLYRPDDPQTLRREARALLAIGLSVTDAAQGLDLSPAALARLLASQATACTGSPAGSRFHPMEIS